MAYQDVSRLETTGHTDIEHMAQHIDQYPYHGHLIYIEEAINKNMHKYFHTLGLAEEGIMKTDMFTLAHFFQKT